MGLAVLVALTVGPRVDAQTIQLLAGDSARIQPAPGTRVTVPITVDLSRASPLNLASLQTTMTWGTDRLQFDSVRAAAAGEFSLTPNLTNASTGSISMSLYRATALPATAPIAFAYFTAAATTGGTRIELSPGTAGNETGQSVLAAIRTRNLDVCVALSGKWGDATGDGTVNVIDAQQIARFSVGLSVSNATALAANGDVTADGSVNVIDAQQIARFTVGLTAAARINTANATSAPRVQTLTLTPGTAQTLSVGAATRILAAPADSAGRSVAGCVPVSWQSLDTTIVQVTSEGRLEGRAAGTTTVQATAGTVTTSLAVTVQSPLTMEIVTQPGSGTSNELLGVQPVVRLLNGGVLATAATGTVSVAIASGTGSLSGTTSVAIVNGVATFADLAITGAGSHTLRFTANGASAVTSASMTVAAPTTLRLLIGSTPSLAGTAGTDVTIPLVIDMSGRSATTNLGALTTIVSWDSTRLAFQGSSAGNWVDSTGGPASITINRNEVTSGRLSITGYTTAPTTSTVTLVTLIFRPVVTGSVAIGATISAAANADAQNVTLRVRALGGTATATPATVASVAIDPTAVSLTPGTTRQFSATPMSTGGTSLTGRTVSWSSSTPAVATVTSTGLVTAVAAGTATITATADGVSSTAVVTVTAGAASLRVLPVYGAYVVGDTGTFAFFPYAADGTTIVPGSYNVAVNGTEIAGGATSCGATGCTQRITAQGLANGSAPVNRTVTMFPAGGSPTSTPNALYRVTIISNVLDSLVIRGGGIPLPTSVGVGRSLPVYPYVYYANGAYTQATNALYETVAGSATWSRCTAGTTALRVQSYCSSATPTDTGTLTIRVSLRKSDGTFWTATKSVQVGRVVNTVTLNPATATIVTGASQTLTATARDSSANVLTGRLASWSSSDTTKVRVTQAGVVTGVAAGTAVITVNIEGKTATSTITVSAGATSLRVMPTYGAYVVGDTGTFAFFPYAADGTTIVPGAYSTAVNGSEVLAGATSCGSTGCTQRITAQGVANGSAPVTRTVTMFPSSGTATSTPNGIYRVTVISNVLDSVRIMGGANPLPASVGVNRGLSIYPYVYFNNGNFSQASNATYETVTGTATWRRCTAGSATLSVQAYCAWVTPSDTGTLTVRVSLRKSDGTFWTDTKSVQVGRAVNTVTLSPTTATLVTGGTQPLAVTARDSSGNVLTGREATWSSSDTTKVRVSSAGVVTGVAAGSAVMTVTVEGKTATASISVTAPGVPGVPPTTSQDDPMDRPVPDVADPHAADRSAAPAADRSSVGARGPKRW